VTDLGTIEGFFGRPYSWAERTDLMRFLAPDGYGFYLYAPKADPYLRRRWREPHPDAEMAALAVFAADCRAAGVRFGVGLSPFELHFDFTPEAKAALTDKLAALDAAGCEWLAILFDDMKGDLSDLARRQAEIVAFAAERTNAARLIVCPSYYTDDPILDRVFGQRPAGYLRDLGAALDPAIDIMWTGEEVCSLEISPGHLARVTDEIGRKPFLWDNYPVNDGPRMSRHLHLRGFTGRPAAIARHLRGHAVNPASQPTLSAIPMLTLAASYAQGDDYAYGRAFQDAARRVCGEALAAQLTADLLTLQDAGLGELSDKHRAKLRARYAAFDRPAAREVTAWLDGAYAVTGEELQTQ
jgi:hyaluronoglucosaminidase